MEKEFTEQQSLSIINQMIVDAKNEVGRGEGRYMVLWGYIIALTCIVHFLAMKFSILGGASSSGKIWITAMVIGAVASFIIGFMSRGKKIVRTYSGSIVSSAWMGFVGLLLIVFFLLSGLSQGYQLIYPAISLLFLYPLFMMIRIFKWHSLWVSLGLCIILVILFKFVDYQYYPLLMAAEMIAGNIVPGHIVNYLGNKDFKNRSHV